MGINNISAPLVPVQSWKEISIYWSNSQTTDFKHTTSLPQLTVPSDARSLSQDVAVTPYEPNPLVPKQKDAVETIRHLAQLEEDFIAIARADNFDHLLLSDDEGAPTPDYKKPVKPPKDARKILKKRVGRIVDAVSQWVIIEIDTGQTIAGNSFPDVEVWAFLQPSTIGNNPYRLRVNNGYVVDDAQKSGWFQAVIQGKQAKQGVTGWTAPLEITRYQKGKASPVSEVKAAYVDTSLLATGKIRYKLEVVVRNEETESDYQRRLETLKERNNANDWLSLECGCWLKIWARNKDFPWGELVPTDEPTEDLREGMDKLDPPADVNRPQTAPNHTWRRSAITDAAVKEENLLYVGLLPTFAIEKLNKVGVELKRYAEFSLPVWIGVTLLYSALLYGLRKYRDKSAEKPSSTTDQKAANSNLSKRRQEEGKKIRDMIEKLYAPEIFAAYSSAGFSNWRDFYATLNDAVTKPEFKAKTAYTSLLYKQMLVWFLAEMEEEFALASSKHAKMKHDYLAKELAKAIDPDFKTDKKKLREQIKENWKKRKIRPEESGSVGGSLSFDLVEFGNTWKFPKPNGRPLPGWFAWLWMAFIIQTKGKLDVTSKWVSTGENKGRLDTSLNGNANIALTFDLHALWGMAEEDPGKPMNKSNQKIHTEVALGKLLEELTQYIDLHIYVAADVGLKKATGTLSCDMDWSDTSEQLFTFNGDRTALGFEFKAPAYAQLSVLCWRYNLAESKFLEAAVNEWRGLSYVMAMGEKVDVEPVGGPFPWADVRTSNYVETTSSTICIGESFSFSLNYAGPESLKAKGSILYVAQEPEVANIKQDTGVAAGGRVELAYNSKKPMLLDTTNSVGKSRNDIFPNTVHCYAKFSVIRSSPSDILLSHREGDAIKRFMDCFVADANDMGAASTGIDLDLRIQAVGQAERVLVPSKKLSLRYPVVKTLGRKDTIVSADKSTVFSVKLANYEDSHVWVRFREYDEYMSDDVVMYKDEQGQYREWNLFQLNRSSGEGVCTIPFDPRRIKNIASLAGITEGEYIEIYPEFAFSDDEDYLLAGQSTINALQRVSIKV